MTKMNTFRKIKKEGMAYTVADDNETYVGQLKF